MAEGVLEEAETRPIRAAQPRMELGLEILLTSAVLVVTETSRLTTAEAVVDQQDRQASVVQPQE